ncbi:C-5 cytosine-specific DNA methylase, partial [Neorhizobium sp. P12A]|uniref:DNA cytosine methyltransferase n=1 Tax=Neorhizobium sp. P12A TaxID=2268027 RepID=UPI0011EEF698
KDYGPLVETDRGLMPDAERKGETFQKWCKALRKLGGKIKYKELRACDYGAPTIRKRLFVIIRFDGQPIVWPEPTHAKPDDPDVIAGRKQPWRTAAEIIDWSLPCPSIFDTSEEVMEKHGLRAVRPLANNTMARVARGMKRYVLDAERPFIVQTGYGERAGQQPRILDIDAPLGTVVAGGVKHGLISPSVIRFNTGATGQDLREPLSTVTANSFIKRPGGAAPLGMIAPHLMTMRNSGKPFNGADEPTHTITAGSAGLSVVAPVLTYAQQGGGNRSVEEPHHTICASKKDQNSVIIPHLSAFYGQGNGGEDRSADVSEPVRTITTENRHAVAAVFVAQHNNDSRRIGGVNPGREVDEPLSTVTATGAQQGIISAFISRQFGASIGHGVDEPSATVTAGVNKSVLVAPHLHAYYGSDQDTPEDEPFHTITTKPRFSHVEAGISAPPFTPDQEDRARRVADFMRSHGFWDDREFVTLIIGGETFIVVDIGMRMLMPRELYGAQGFPPEYIIDGVYAQPAGGGDAVWVPFSKSVQVSCVGNSVSPPVACALVWANCSHLALQMEAA